MFRSAALACLLLGVAAAAPVAAATTIPGYVLKATTELPDMPEGDFDQLVLDSQTHRLYVSAEDGAKMDVFDPATGRLLQAGGPVGSPHIPVMDEATGHLLVADGADGSVKVLDRDLRLVARIPVGAKPDTGVIDPAGRVFYVSSRDGGPDAATSIVSAISLDKLQVMKTFPVPSTTLKGLVLDKAGRRLFVSMREKDSIGVIHLDGGALETWSPKGLHKNVPLGFDAAHNQLFVGSRLPGRLYVLSAADGAVRQVLPCTETADSMSFDPVAGVIYVSGDTGMSRYQLAADGVVRLVSTDPALIGKTSLWVPALHRLYVMRPRHGTIPAALQIFEPTP